MNGSIERIISEIEKAVTGKREAVEKTLMALLAGGHILLNDVPGVGKTTLALAVSRALGLKYRRISFTPDVLPSDIVGFTMYDRHAGGFRYVPGAAIGVNLLLGDEINRTSSKTQSALLEAMEERRVTVDGESHTLEEPFCVIATQNQVGAAGTQPLPHAQMDRFLIELSLGYPDEAGMEEIIRSHRLSNPVDNVSQAADVREVLALQHEVRLVTMKDSVVSYIARLASASQGSGLLQLGISPRGALFVSRMAQAAALFRGRDYVIPEDVQAVFCDVCAHRVITSQEARSGRLSARDVLRELLESVPLPGSR